MRQPESAAARVALAGFYRHQGQPAEARAAALAAIQTEPTNPVGYVALAEAKLRAADFAGAREGYQKALALSPEDLTALSGLAHLEANLGDSTAAGAATKRLREFASYEPRSEVFLAIGHALVDERQFSNATDAFQQALNLTPVTASSAYDGLGEIQLAQKQVGQARDLYTQAIRVGPNDPRAWHAWGSYLLSQPDWTGADAAFTKAIALAGGEAAGYVGRGRVAEEQGQTAQARDQFRRGLAAEPGSPDVHVALGKTMEASHPDTAQAEFQEAIRLEPAFARSYLELGDLLLTTGYLDGALTAFLVIHLIAGNRKETLADRVLLVRFPRANGGPGEHGGTGRVEVRQKGPPVHDRDLLVVAVCLRREFLPRQVGGVEPFALGAFVDIAQFGGLEPPFHRKDVGLLDRGRGRQPAGRD